jgi:hypothetical protein
VLHGKHLGETTSGPQTPAPDPLDQGLLIGILISQGHFGGDGRQPQVTVKMHVRHEPLMRWLLTVCPGSRLYGPYHYDSRHFFQWMVRGKPLRETLIPILDGISWGQIDEHSYARYAAMKARYGL